MPRIVLNGNELGDRVPDDWQLPHMVTGSSGPDMPDPSDRPATCDYCSDYVAEPEKLFIEGTPRTFCEEHFEVGVKYVIQDQHPTFRWSDGVPDPDEFEEEPDLTEWVLGIGITGMILAIFLTGYAGMMISGGDPNSVPELLGPSVGILMFTGLSIAIASLACAVDHFLMYLIEDWA